MSSGVTLVSRERSASQVLRTHSPYVTASLNDRGITVEENPITDLGSDIAIPMQITENCRLTVGQWRIVCHLLRGKRELQIARGESQTARVSTDQLWLRILHTPVGTGKTHMSLISMIYHLQTTAVKTHVASNTQALETGTVVRTMLKKRRTHARIGLVCVPTHIKSQWDQIAHAIADYLNAESVFPRKIHVHTTKRDVPWERICHATQEEVFILVRKLPWEDASLHDELRERVCVPALKERGWQHYLDDFKRVGDSPDQRAQIRQSMWTNVSFAFDTMVIDEGDGTRLVRQSSQLILDPYVDGPIFVCQATVMNEKLSNVLPFYSAQGSYESKLSWKRGYGLYSKLKHLAAHNLPAAYKESLMNNLAAPAGLGAFAEFYASLLPEAVYDSFLADSEKYFPLGIQTIQINVSRVVLNSSLVSETAKDHFNALGKGANIQFHRLLTCVSVRACLETQRWTNGRELQDILASSPEVKTMFEMAQKQAPTEIPQLPATLQEVIRRLELYKSIANSFSRASPVSFDAGLGNSLHTAANDTKEKLDSISNMECLVCAVQMTSIEEMCVAKCCTAVYCSECYEFIKREQGNKCGYCTKQLAGVQLREEGEPVKKPRITPWDGTVEDFKRRLLAVDYRAEMKHVVASLTEIHGERGKSRLVFYVPLANVAFDNSHTRNLLKNLQSELNEFKNSARDVFHVLPLYRKNISRTRAILREFNDATTETSVFLVLAHSANMNLAYDQVAGLDLGRANAIYVMFPELSRSRMTQIGGRGFRIMQGVNQWTTCVHILYRSNSKIT